MKKHLTYLGIENFRVFKDRTDFDFAPITILTGTNSSGKSSLIKAILLLKSNAERITNNSEISTLKFGIDLKIGNINTAKNNQRSEQPMVFHFPISFSFSEDRHILSLKYQDEKDQDYKYHDQNGKIIGLEVVNKNQQTVLYSLYKRNHQSVIQVNFWELLKNSNLITNNKQRQYIKGLGKKPYIPEESPNGDFFKTNLERFLDTVIESIDANLFEDTIALKEEMNEKIVGAFQTAIQDVNEILATPNFIPSNRSNVQRHYQNTVTDYFTSVVEDGKKQSYTHAGHANAFVNKYLEEFKIGLGFNIDMAKDSTSYTFEIRNKNKELINIADLGFGISQVLPIILKLGQLIYENYNDYGANEFQDSLFEPTLEPSILIIEEPETNLHPGLQSKLADMFAEAATKYKIRFIIETHSEYLIRKLQYLTAKGEIQPEHTQIYYFYPPDDVPPREDQVKKINIQEDGSLNKEFGRSFFDEADNLAIDLYTLLTQNRKN